MTEEEKAFLEKEKSIIEKVGGGTIVTLILLAISLISTFALSQYKIGELQSEVEKLNAGSKSVIVLEQQLKDISKSVDELKDQNKETYRLLLDISQR